MDPERLLDRRSLLLVSAGLLVTGSACTADNEPRSPGRGTKGGSPSQSSTGSTAQTTTQSTTPSSTTPTTPADPSALPTPTPWRPSSGDLHPDVKATAARVVEAIGSWSVGQRGPANAARRVDALGQSRRLSSATYPTLHPRASAAALEVIEAQYGGLLATTASVLVVCRQWWADESGQVGSGGTTVDVRLTKGNPHWRVTAVNPGVLPTPARPIPRLAQAVLAEPRIDLPPAARADVASGDVHDTVLTAMLRLARTYRIGVSVVRCGHPTYVFGTDRVSDHIDGRAFDTWRVNGHPVVDPATPRRLVTDYMQAAAGAGAYNVGGPYPLTDGAANFFTDAAHHDHVHAAFST